LQEDQEEEEPKWVEKVEKRQVRKMGGGGAQIGRGFVCSGAATSSSWIGRVSFTTSFHDGEFGSVPSTEARDGRVRMSVRMWEVESRDSL
jgi:hypothetical protein